MPDVVVVGGGISAVATAYEIARAGHSVLVLEKRRLAAMGSGWTLGGIRQSGRDPAELPLAQAAVERWAGLDEELGATTDYRRGGNLRLARAPAEVEVIEALVDEQRSRGLDMAYLADNAAIRAFAPAIASSVLAASFCPTDGHADPVSTVAAYAAAAVRAGAEIREGVTARRVLVESGRVVGVETDEGVEAADRVVVATGVHAPELLGPLGLALPLTIKLVAVLQTVPTTPVLEQVFGVANADAAGRQEVDGRFRITTGIGAWPHDPAVWDEHNIQPTLDDLARLVGSAVKVLPVLAGVGVARVWGGLIDLTPDGLPALDGCTGIEGLVLAAGFSGHGFGIGPVTGEILADLVLGRPPRFDLGPFRLGRFAVSTERAAELTLHG
jgi:sarcosine oxidase subunit beta